MRGVLLTHGMKTIDVSFVMRNSGLGLASKKLIYRCHIMSLCEPPKVINF